MEGVRVESITKNRQPIPVLRAMVARAYGADQVSDRESWVCELGHGWFNVAYRIRLRDRRDVVLKIAPPADVEVMSSAPGAFGSAEGESAGSRRSSRWQRAARTKPTAEVMSPIAGCALAIGPV